MPSQTKYPTAVATWSEDPWDDNDWSNPTNVEADDGAYASITSALFDAPDYSYLMRVDHFGFTIPAGATIDGIVVEINRFDDPGELGKDATLKILQYGSYPCDDDKADTVNTWPTSLTRKSYGGPTDLWGPYVPWTPDVVNSPNTRVVFAAQAATDNADIYVDSIRMTVYYTLGGGGNARKANKIAPKLASIGAI